MDNISLELNEDEQSKLERSINEQCYHDDFIEDMRRRDADFRQEVASQYWFTKS